MCVTSHPSAVFPPTDPWAFLWRPQITFRRQHRLQMRPTRTTCSRKVEVGGFIRLSHDLKTPSKTNNHICCVAFRRLLFRHYVYLHCSQLRGRVKPSINTSLSYHAILASVSIANWVQTRSGEKETWNNLCSPCSYFNLGAVGVLILFYPALLLSTSPDTHWTLEILIL